MFLQIFTMTHKKFEIPSDSMYIPLHVGRALSKDLGYLGDNTGDHISTLNPYYSELTGLYWIWKNIHYLDYVGTCHYRRYLVNHQEKVFTEAEYRELFKTYDIITTKRVELNHSYYYGFSEVHHQKDLDLAADVIRKLYPQDYSMFEKLVHENETYFGNIFVTSKKLYDNYCAWLFPIFFEMQKQMDVSSYDDYHKRVFGFISEFLQLVWIRLQKCKVLECLVGMIGEKAETKEMKERLAAYFKEKNISLAKQYFIESLKKRPDVLLEASDITGELRMSMQVISTCEFELQEYGHCILDFICDFHDLMDCFTKLNRAVEHFKWRKETEFDKEFLRSSYISKIAIDIAVTILCKEEVEEVKKRIVEVNRG